MFLLGGGDGRRFVVEVEGLSTARRSCVRLFGEGGG